MLNHEVIITGSTGLLGRGLLATSPESVNTYPVYSKNTPPEDGHKYKRVDISNLVEVLALFKEIKPSIIIHAASIGNVDYCEKNPEEAKKVNITGTQNIVKACNEFGTRLIFISTNAVFDGTKAPYTETSTTNPVNYYGETKSIGEKMVLEASPDDVVVRMTLIYGWNNANQRSNAVTWLLDKLRRNEPTKLVDDTYVNPIYNLQAAEAIWRIIDLDINGIINMAGKDRVNRYKFGVEIAEAFGYDPKLLTAVSSDYFPGIAKRMPDTSFDTSKMIKTLGIKPLSIIKGLNLMKQQSP
jgi:dTDP-4-dehydrorhamnose reductase